MAATAASQPLLSGPSTGARERLASVSVVRTPNAMGTPVSPAARVSPCATARADVVEVRRLAPNQAAQAHDRVESAGLGDGAGRLRQLESPRHCERLDVGRASARLGSAARAPSRRPVGDRLVEP